MNRAEAKGIIIDQFISEFNETTPVNLSNQGNFILCTSPITNTVKPSDSAWVRFMVENNITPKATLGTKGHRRFRRTGFISSQIFIPEGVGTKIGNDLCEELISIFEGERLGDIAFDYGEYDEIGNIENNLYQFNVIIYYFFDEQK